MDQVKALLDEGLDVNFTRSGFSPLCQALVTGNRAVMDLLIAHGASLSAPGSEHFLSLAAGRGDHELIDLALAAGHDIHFRATSTAATPLEAAAHVNRHETMKYLIARGAAREDFRLKCRWFGLHRATINVLLELGVDVPQDLVHLVKTGNWHH